MLTYWFNIDFWHKCNITKHEFRHLCKLTTRRLRITQDGGKRLILRNDPNWINYSVSYIIFEINIPYFAGMTKTQKLLAYRSIEYLMHLPVNKSIQPYESQKKLSIKFFFTLCMDHQPRFVLPSSILCVWSEDGPLYWIKNFTFIRIFDYTMA